MGELERPIWVRCNPCDAILLPNLRNLKIGADIEYAFLIKVHNLFHAKLSFLGIKTELTHTIFLSNLDNRALCMWIETINLTRCVNRILHAYHL